MGPQSFGVPRPCARVDLTPFFPNRPEDARKGDYGRVLVVGGSDRYSGAPTFNALAALRSGADMVSVVAPRRSADIVAGFSPDLITVPCETPHPIVSAAPDLLESSDCAVIGGGVVRKHDAHAALLEWIVKCEKPMVLDAEALHAIVRHDSLLENKKALLTPHGGEYKVLTGNEWPKDMDARKDAARELAQQYHATVVVKGRYEVISDGKDVWVDEAGSPYLTKGGYGDLLAGSAGAFLARGASLADAARAAAYLIGSAGARAGRELGESTLASDALARVPEVLRDALGRDKNGWT